MDAYGSRGGGVFFYYNLLDLEALSNNYAAIEKKLAEQRSTSGKPYYLPMEPEAPDFVFTDIDAQVVVLKHGEDRMYTMFNWKRPRWQITDITRIHMLTPMVRRVANVMGAHKGEVKLIPASDQNPRSRARSGEYYDHRSFELLNQVRYGKYLIAQNISKTRTFQMDAPGVRRAVDLATKQVYTQFPITVKPRTAVVLEIVDESAL